VLELKNKLEECRGKKAIRVLKHMESLNGDYSEYLNNADEDDIENIQCCCDMFRKRDYKTTKRGREII